MKCICGQTADYDNINCSSCVEDWMRRETEENASCDEQNNPIDSEIFF